MHCHGNESKLIECSNGHFDSKNCDGADAGVICTSKYQLQCNNKHLTQFVKVTLVRKGQFI